MTCAQRVTPTEGRVQLVRRFELVADEFGVPGSTRLAMPDDVYERFCRLRDGRIPTPRA